LSSKDDVDGGHFIPKGQIGFQLRIFAFFCSLEVANHCHGKSSGNNLNVYLRNVQSNPSRPRDITQNPEEFMPERFLNEDGSVRDDSALSFVFGTGIIGKSICPGSHFVDATVFIVTFSVLSVFIHCDESKRREQLWSPRQGCGDCSEGPQGGSSCESWANLKSSSPSS